MQDELKHTQCHTLPLTHICALLSTSRHLCPGLSHLKTGVDRQRCGGWLGSRGRSSGRAVLHQTPPCLSGTCTLWRMLSQHMAYVESSPSCTPNPLCDCAVRKKPGLTFSLTFCLCSGTNPMPRKWEQILLLMSLWNCMVPQAALPHL